MKSIKVIIASAMLLSSTAVLAANTTVMQCQLTNGRNVSVEWNGSNLSYAYGKPGAKPELALAGDKAHFGHDSFAQGEGSYYRFTNGAYDYVTYFAELNAGDVNNLGIFKNGKLIKQIKCKGGFKTGLTNLFQPVSSAIPVDDGSIDYSVNE